MMEANLNSGSLAKSEATYSETPTPGVFALESKRMDLDSGLLGKVFGNATIAPTNIAGVTLLLLLLAGFALLFWSSAAMATADYWQKILPIATLILGYLFGKKG